MFNKNNNWIYKKIHTCQIVECCTSLIPHLPESSHIFFYSCLLPCLVVFFGPLFALRLSQQDGINELVSEYD